MEDKNLQQENKNLKSRNEELQAKLDAIEKNNQQKTKFQLWLGRIGLGFLLGPGLNSSMQQLYTELPANVKRDTLADVTTQVIWRFTRIGLLAVLVAMIPTILLWQQNQKIDEQTKLFQKQNDKIDSQIQLEESSRRGNLIVMMSNIMDKVDEEIRRAQEQGDSSRSLSPQLIGRIGALSYAFRPYRFLQDNVLIEKPLSPERGQLLLALVNSDLDSLTYRNIYREATFEQAYLEKANFREANLSKAVLNNANLSYADLWNANLNKAKLRYANLAYANLTRADLSNSDLVNADLRHATLRYANLRSAALLNVNLEYTDLEYADLESAILRSVKLNKSKMKYANLAKADLNNADLVNADLWNTRVDRKDWVKELEKQEVKKMEIFHKTWMVDTTLQQDIYGEYYRIKYKK